MSAPLADPSPPGSGSEDDRAFLLNLASRSAVPGADLGPTERCLRWDRFWSLVHQAAFAEAFAEAVQTDRVVQSTFTTVLEAGLRGMTHPSAALGLQRFGHSAPDERHRAPLHPLLRDHAASLGVCSDKAGPLRLALATAAPIGAPAALRRAGALEARLEIARTMASSPRATSDRLDAAVSIMTPARRAPGGATFLDALLRRRPVTDLWVHAVTVRGGVPSPLSPEVANAVAQDAHRLLRERWSDAVDGATNLASRFHGAGWGTMTLFLRDRTPDGRFTARRFVEECVKLLSRPGATLPDTTEDTRAVALALGALSALTEDAELARRATPALRACLVPDASHAAVSAGGQAAVTVILDPETADDTRLALVQGIDRCRTLLMHFYWWGIPTCPKAPRVAAALGPDAAEAVAHVMVSVDTTHPEVYRRCAAMPTPVLRAMVAQSRARSARTERDWFGVQVARRLARRPGRALGIGLVELLDHPVPEWRALGLALAALP